MRLFKTIVLVALAVGAEPLRAQSLPHRLRLKAGFNLAHLVISPDVRGRLVVPLALGAEYRVGPQLSLYAQAEAYLPTGRVGGNRRAQATPPLVGGTGALGARYYYHHARANDSVARRPARFGDYLALEGSGEWQALAAARGRGRSRTVPARLVPGVYALVGTQRGWAGHPLLFDANAGLGLQAPAQYYYRPEQAPAHAWAVAAQVNLRVYFGH
ncbi:hypothetical protein [Hymenobacter sp. PAMC 26628]|uniref:hypothetical protein n=1 Tax=Hymenobacter sp. PAMC 26628 TaxID=1484118 RepID=UPI0007701F13|nr:hypothetical protein [Hymenobacter sp. PAMC 26628]AMJ67731.1 hypothetical protein AXW84_21650 [Hymenobacter sp. PAMC 26628]